MKNLLRTILLMGILCLAGCSKEDPQSVSISRPPLIYDEELGVSNISLRIHANCAWTITDKLGLYSFNPSSGNGNADVIVHIGENNTYDDIKNEITVTSEDGSSSYTFHYTQEGKKGFLAEFPEMFPAEGGTFDIPVKTNIASDEIIIITDPEWMELTSSTRGLKDYVYTFIVSPNESGIIREGSVDFGLYRFKVKQDSYTPTSITLESVPPFVLGGSETGDYYSWLNITIEPEHADLSKIKLECSEKCEANISYRDLGLSLYGFGHHSIRVAVGDSTFHQINTESVPRWPLKGDLNSYAYLGQKEGIVNWVYYSSQFVLNSSDISVIRVVDGNHFETVGIGSASISVEIPGTEVHQTKNVQVDHFILDAWVDQLSQREDGSYDVIFATMVKGPESLKILSADIKDLDKNRIQTLGDPAYNSEDKSFTMRSQTFNVNFDRTKYSSVNDFLLRYSVEVKVSIDGAEYNRLHYLWE